MTIKRIFIPSLKATFQKKWLWLLALFSITPLTIQNEWQLIVNVLNALTDPQNYFWLFTRIQLGTFSFSNLLETSANEPLGIISLIVVGILIITVFFFVAWVIVHAQGMLIYAQSVKQRTNTFSFKNVINKIDGYWIPLLELNLFLVVSKVLAISILLITMALFSNGVLLGIRIIIFIITMAILIFISFTVRIALFKIILENKSMRESVKEAIIFVKKRLYECYELSFILYSFTLIILAIIITVSSLIVSEEQLGETVLFILFLRDGIVPFILLTGTITIFALTTGFLALLRYTTWLTWYSQVSEHNFQNSYLQRFVKRIKSYVKRPAIN